MICLVLNTWNCPCPLERIRPESLSLYPFLSQLKPLQIKSLHLHSLCDTSSDLAPFLETLTNLQMLSLYFVVIKERRNSPWRDMLMRLKSVLGRVRNLEMYIDHWDAFELTKWLQSERLAAETPHNEVWDDDESWDGDAWTKLEKPERNVMLEILAQAMPHYNNSVFRTCKMGYSLSRWY